jgi:pyridoxal phosphate enzyme (YggS family)
MGIAENLQKIQSRIRESALRAERDPAGITLVAVTKYVDVSLVNEAIRRGVTDIAENRVQDALRKFPQIEGQVTKHFIGSLQTNKVKPVIANFQLIHSVDRIELIDELARQSAALSQTVPILIQLNISGETTKHGFGPSDLAAVLERLHGHPYLKPSGLMTMAPLSGNPEIVRPVFRRLRELFDRYRTAPDLTESWRYLSMGMSQDFEVAVEEGANLLRIGTAIFTLE